MSRIFNFWTALALVACALFFLFASWADRHTEGLNAKWAAWEASMSANGCKVRQFVATKSSVYPVWVCPDGVAHKGRPQ